MLALLLVFVTAKAAFVLATHTFTLVNHCSYGVPVYVDNTYSSVPYVSLGVMFELMEGTNIHVFLSIDWAAAGHYWRRL
jgi:hypothetical protein